MPLSCATNHCDLAVKFTESGSITVECRRFEEPIGLRNSAQIVIQITVADTGCGIENDKLESIFREFEQVEQSAGPGGAPSSGLGLGKSKRGFAQLNQSDAQL